MWASIFKIPSSRECNWAIPMYETSDSTGPMFHEDEQEKVAKTRRGIAKSSQVFITNAQIVASISSAVDRR